MGESEVTTAGDRQLIVTVPNVQRDELVRAGRPDRRAPVPGRVRRRAGHPPPAPEPTAGADGVDRARRPSPPPSDARPERVAPAWCPSPVRPATTSRFPALPTAPPQPAGRGLPVGRRPGHAARPGDRVAARASPARPRSPSSPAVRRCDDVADQPLFACDREGTEKYLLGPTLIEGDQLATASAGIPANDVTWVVDLEFNAEGATVVRGGHPGPVGQGRAAEPVRHRAGRRRRSPRRRSARRSPAAAPRSPATSPRRARPSWPTCLKYGALPLAFDVSEVNNVSATLGGEQLRAGIIAGIIGLALVVRSASPTTAGWASWWSPRWRSPG